MNLLVINWSVERLGLNSNGLKSPNVYSNVIIQLNLVVHGIIENKSMLNKIDVSYRLRTKLSHALE